MDLALPIEELDGVFLGVLPGVPTGPSMLENPVRSKERIQDEDGDNR